MKKLSIALFSALFLSLSLMSGLATSGRSDNVNNYGPENWMKKNFDKTRLMATVRDYETLTVAVTLVDTQCGSIFFLNATTEFATTLPLPLAGCSFKFIVKAAPAAADYTVLTSASANILIGGINELEVDTTNDGPYDADGDTVTFADGVAAVGDYVEMFSDGTSWYISGQANLDGGITVTKAS